jgi:hypothetical protein
MSFGDSCGLFLRVVSKSKRFANGGEALIVNLLGSWPKKASWGFLMNRFIPLCAVTFMAFGSIAQAGDLAPEVKVKFIKIIALASGGKVACSDPAVKGALEAQGVVVDGGARVVYVTNAAEAKQGKQMNKLVISARRDLMNVSSVVLDEDSGRPKLLINTSNLTASRVPVGDAIMKIGEKSAD